MSAALNRATIQMASHTAAKLGAIQVSEDEVGTTRDLTQAALTLDALQKQLDTLEAHQQLGAPWYTRFGMNRDADLLSALQPAWETASERILVQPMRGKIENSLRQLGSLSDQELASGGDAQTKLAYTKLKAYLMLANPQRADPTFLVPQLLATGEPVRPVNSPLSPGAWRDLTQRLITFYANHHGAHRSAEGSRLAIVPDAALVSAARQTLVSVMGLQNSTDAVYQQIIDENRGKYPPVSLQALLGDTSSRGLFATAATVPGVFTRAAWDERIGKAIDNAAEQRGISADWVLSDAQKLGAPGKTSKDGLSASAPAAGSLKGALRQRYFNDYARAWQEFLNSARWQPDTGLSGTIDQLTLLADPQRSPLSTLMKVIVYQAGTGATGQSLSDNLMTKAQQLVNRNEHDPSKISAQRTDAPLAAAFGPLLRLAGNDGPGNTSTQPAVGQFNAMGDISLPRYLERATAVRLKLQQILMSGDPDAMARGAAQAILQGKTSNIAASRDYAARVAASFGEQWSGFGNALFQHPLDQAWDVVLRPAAASLNETWRTSIVADWNRLFGGRYPFTDSNNDASLPEMARFLRADNGVITQFVSTQLAGIIERQGDRWVISQGAGHNALTVDPNFVSTLNRLMRVSNLLFPSGDASVRYELRAVSTPGITDMKFKLSGRELHYFNQREEWTPFVWPGDALENNSHIEWQTEQGGLRSALHFEGRFGLIRLLEHATVTQQDSARHLLKWSPDAPKVATSNGAPETTPSRATGLGLPLRVELRSEAGSGPLEALTLRNFALPTRIFLVGTAAKTESSHASATPQSGAMPETE